MKLTRYAVVVLLSACLAGTAWGQRYPGDRSIDNNSPSRRPNNPNNVIKTTGPTQAPDPTATAQEIPDNQKTIPAPESTNDKPSPIDDQAFANVVRKASAAIVRINMPPEGRRALGFLINGPDEEHKLVVTTFYGTAREDFSRGFWFDVRLASDWGTKLEVEGVHVCDEVQDLAILRVKAPKNRKVEFLELAKDNPKPKDAVYAVGYNRAVIDWTARGAVDKIVEGTDVNATPGSQWVRTDAVITPGNVGGPLLNAEGKVVGVCASHGSKVRGPFLSVPVAKIRELLTREPFANGRFVGAEGSFRWPESKDTESTATYSKDRIMTAASAIKRSLDCKTCNGFGYLVTPEYTIDRNTGRQTKTGERHDVCTDCGGAGVVLKPSLQDLLSTVSLYMLNPDDKVDEPTMVKIKAIAAEGFDRAAVNRQLLVDCLMPFADRILGEYAKNIGQAVTFVAQVGPTVTVDKDTKFQWVKPYKSETWLLTYGADVRNVAGTSAPAATAAGGGRRPGAPPAQPAQSAYVLVSGVIRGLATIESNKQFFQAPLLKVSDLVRLRP